jgi:cell division transport system permease protein
MLKILKKYWRPRTDLPLAHDDIGRFMPWFLGIMVFFACFSLIGALETNELNDKWQHAIQDTLLIEVPTVENQQTNNEVLSKAFQVLRATPGVEQLRMVTKEESAELLKPWIGDNQELLTEFSFPSLIEVATSHERLNLHDLQIALDKAIPGANINQHNQWLTTLHKFSMSLKFLSFSILIAIMLGVIITVIYTSRMSLAIHHHHIEILRLIGASNNYISKQFEKHFFVRALKGTIFATLIAFTLLLWLSNISSENLLFQGISLNFSKCLALIALPLVVSAFAIAVARIVILRRLGSSTI